MNNKLPKLIALSGHRRSGKDTAALHIMAKYEYRPISFARILKDMVANTYNIARGWMDDQDKKEMPLIHLPVISTDAYSEMIHWQLREELKSGYWTPRALLILEGSTKRSVHSNFWVRPVIDVVMSDTKNNYVITDMRYCNEADVLKMMIPSTMCIRIERAGNTLLTEEASERDLDGYRFDRVIHNNGTIDDFHTTIDIHLGEDK